MKYIFLTVDAIVFIDQIFFYFIRSTNSTNSNTRSTYFLSTTCIIAIVEQDNMVNIVLPIDSRNRV